jgi:hypothetical protein
MTKAEACELLHISESTLQRRMKAGVYQFTRGDGQFDPVIFTYEGLGLVEPTPETPAVDAHDHQVPTAEPTPPPEATITPRPLSGIEAKERDDLFFAAQYKAGNATDSAGNKVDGTNDKFITKGSQSLLGPVEIDRTPANPQAHMDQALIVQPGPDGGSQYLNSLERQRDCGHITVSQYETLTTASSKAHRMSEQASKSFVDREVMAAAFRHGYSR